MTNIERPSPAATGAADPATPDLAVAPDAPAASALPAGTVPAEATAAVVHGGGAWADFRRRVARNRGAMIALGVLALLVLVAAIGPFITPADPNQQNLRGVLLDPFTAGHVLGTDQLGRDILSRLIVGTRVSLLAICLALAVAMVIGVPLGFLTGYIGGRFDTVVMRLNDAAMSFPPLLLAIALVAVLGPSLRNAMFAVGILMAPRFLRLVRGVVIGLKEETYVEASRSIGTPPATIILRHILPNTLSPLTVAIAVTAGYAMLSEAGLSFLGLGVQPPDASWGSMIREGFLYYGRSPWLGIFPGVLIALTVFTFVTLGDGLRDALGREERTES
ncbi:ABC transporter permease [Pseudonocardia humida]|uniref:ABC transporter permease n=1 Tax=Pseudonocardia humida TaxID=2800819 RepID=A0ABT0ZYH6_9PSEU|nr:ABC transporter permease [Pseudonocardia humida]MCO1655709.1 ABC transporter permease [Pseudonocardia humida]